MPVREVLLIIAWVFLPNIYSYAQQIAQTRQLGGTGYDTGMSMATDAAGNLYQAATFQNTVIIGSDTLTSAGDHNSYLAKFTPGGSAEWAIHFSGTGVIAVSEVACDSAGNCYLTGRFSGQFYVVADTLISTSDDGFLIRTLPNGTVDWAMKFGGAATDYGTDVYVDKYGRCYLAGTFRNSITLGPYTYVIMPPATRVDAFVALFDTIGQVLWANRAGCTDCQSTVSDQIVCDNQGNVYLSGSNSGKGQFDQVQFGHNGWVGCFLFVVKFGQNGQAEWAKEIVGTGMYCSPMGLCTDESGNLYFLNWTSFSTNLGAENYNLHKIRADSTEVFLEGAENAPSGEYGSAIPYQLVADTNGNTLVAGTFAGKIMIGNAILETDMWAESPFLACYDSSGNALWATRLTTGTDVDYAYPYGLAWQQNGQAWVTGYFAGTATFGSQTLTSNGPTDIFLLQLSNVTGLEEPEQAFSSDLILFPNPTSNSVNLSFSLSQPAQVSYLLTDITGRVLHQQSVGSLIQGKQQVQIPVNNLSAGIYFCTLQAGQNMATRKLVIAR